MITSKGTLLLIIDVQGRLAQCVFQPTVLENNISKLIRACANLEVPVMVTEQYPKGLGHTIDSLRELLPDSVPVEKISFSCCGNEEFMRQLRSFKSPDHKNLAGMKRGNKANHFRHEKHSSILWMARLGTH